MLQKALIALLVVLLLGAGLAAYFAADSANLEQPPSLPTATATASEAVAAASTPTQPTDATADTGSAERAVAEALTDATQRPLPDKQNWIEVKVIDKATGSPSSGAIVHWFDETAWEYLVKKQPELAMSHGELHWQGERLAELAGWRTRSNAEGQARVTGKGSLTVIAQHESLYGKLQLQSNAVLPIGGHVIELVPELCLLVRAVNERGQPCVNVPVSVAIFTKGGDQIGPFGWSALANTRAPDGIATIRHLQSLRADVFGWGEEASANLVWRARLFLPGVAEQGTAFNPLAPPTEPIELRVPPCGSVRIRGTFAGKPLPGFDSASISAVQENEHRFYDSARQQPVDADGQVRFAWVPIGQPYNAYTQAIGGISTTFAGPRASGQEVEVVLEPTGDTVLLTGRLLMPDRTPLAEQKVQARATGPELRNQVELGTDRDGRFLFSVGTAQKENRVDQLWFELRRTGEQPLRAEASGRTLRAGSEELGDLVLGDGTLVVAGRVVANGEPYLTPVQLRVERESAADGKRAAQWRRVDGMLNHQDGAGGFAIRGTAIPGRYRLVPSTDRALPTAPIEFAVGASDVVVSLDCGQSFAASVLLPDGASSQFITVALVPPTPPTPSTPTSPDGRRNDRLTSNLGQKRGPRHDVLWPAVPAGTYSLEVRLWAIGKPLVTIAGVVLPLPKEGDARLVDIDLRSLVRNVTLGLHGADGVLIENANGLAFPAVQASSTEWVGLQLYGTKPQLLLPTGPFDLLVCLSGYRPLPARGNSDHIDLRCDLWPTLSVLVPGIPKLPEKARVTVSLKSPSVPDQRYRSQWSSGERSEYMQPQGHQVSVRDGKASVPIGEGIYGLRVQVSANRQQHTIEGHTPTEVLSTAGEVTVAVPAAQWQKAIEAISKPAK